MESEFQTHPAILAFIEVFGDRIDAQIKEMKEKGMLPDKGIIYKRPDPRDLQRWENQLTDWDYDSDSR